MSAQIVTVIIVFNELSNNTRMGELDKIIIKKSHEIIENIHTLQFYTFKWIKNGKISRKYTGVIKWKSSNKKTRQTYCRLATQTNKTTRKQDYQQY